MPSEPWKRIQGAQNTAQSFMQMSRNKIFTELDRVDVLPQKLKNRLSPLVSPRTGLINAILQRNEYLPYGLHAYQCLSCQTKILTGHSRSATSGGFGFHKDPGIALASCIYEAIERYCLAFKPPDLLTAKLSELPEDSAPDKLSLYTKEQYQNGEYSNPEICPVEWIKAIDYRNPCKSIYWPASLVYIPYENMRPVAETTSTGVAANDDFETAFFSGLCENIERDAVMINTMRNLRPPAIDLDTITGEPRPLVDSLSDEFNIRIHRLYSDIDLPVYLSFIWKQTNMGLHYGIGASANLDSGQAISKSLKECLFTYTYSLDMLDMRQADPKNIKGLHEHFLYYQSDDFWKLPYDDARTERYSENCTTLDDVLTSLKKSGIDAYHIELTTSDVCSAGIRVIRVITPGLIDLNKTHDMPRLAAERYWDVPKILGLQGSHVLWDMPHPFP